MRITVNSEPRDLPEGTTLAQLISELGLDKSACAAEVNKTLVPKRQHAGQPLRDGDTVELVTLVGGG
ncbi:MAG TPA: sulfur carrier protein ThiS [Phycisphaerales bacterium]|nr:sulfur carrier protein ThiS [Phycisphaerales bacterium]